MAKAKESIRFRLRDHSQSGGKVSARLLAETLSSIQDVVTSIGRSTIRLDSAKRGRLREEYTDEFRLYIVNVEKGSLVAELELPKLQQDMFSERQELNRQIVKTFKSIVQSYYDEDYAKLSQQVPDETYRTRVLRGFHRIAKDEQSPQSVEFATGPGARYLKIHPVDKMSHREFYSELADIEILDDEASAETVYRVRCTALVQNTSELKRDDIKEILDSEVELQAETVAKLRSFTCSGKMFQLKRQLKLIIEHEDDLFTIRYPRLDILAYGDSRAAVIQAFKAEMSYIWHEYALSPDEHLMDHARLLKREIKRLIKGVEAIEGTQGD